MPFVYARSMVQACNKCNNVSNADFCKTIAIRLIKRNKGRNNTYDCLGFEPKAKPKPPSIYPSV